MSVDERCTEWDATEGMRCVVDGCSHNAVKNGWCPHHLAPAEVKKETDEELRERMTSRWGD